MTVWVDLKPPEPPPGRHLFCNCCGALVNVHEFPPHLDEDRFVGGCCLTPVDPDPEPTVTLRRPDYDPATVPWPPGF